jgi:hypothetical protein
MYEVTVACVLRSGSIYDASWVARLQRGVARHLTVPHRFVCLSDVPVECERIPLLTEWPGWWSKLELFRPKLFSGTVLYFDLDTLIVGNLDAIARHPHRITMAHEYYRPAQLCSTAMAWNGGEDFGLFEAFRSDPAGAMKRHRSFASIGDQGFIEDQLKARGIKADTFRDLFGETSIASYKVHKCKLAPARGAVAVAFHGRPKPHEILDGWVAAAWAA